ncbi:2-keto-4-pentenoate hydratase [Nonomuraea thailandensis]
MTDWTIERTAEVLLQAERTRADRGPITDEWPGLDLATAYRAQDVLLERRKAAGETVVGVKLGLTSRAKQLRMGIDAPLTAWLTDAMVLPAGTPVQVDELIHPRVEPEIVFVLKDRLAGPGVTAASAMAAVGAVHGGFEVIDSATATSGSRCRTWSPTTPRPPSSASARWAWRPAGWTCPCWAACWRWTARSWTPRPAPPSRAIPARRWPWRRTRWPSAGWPWRPGGSC